MAQHSTQSMLPIWKKPLDSAIHLRVYINGDKNYPGKNVTLNKRQQRSFESWLKDLSTCMRLRSGAVWRVFTPNHGHRVDDLETLEDGHMVVVAGQEKFKPLRYAQIESTPRKTAPISYDVEPGHNRRYQVSGRYRKIETHAKIIKCWPNGDDTHAPKTIVLPAHRNKCESLEGVLDQVSVVMCHDCHGPVSKLYLPNGIKVMSMDQIMDKANYVALRKNDRFKRAHYKEVSLPNLACSPRLERRLLAPLPRSNKTSSQSSPEHSISSNNGSEKSYTQRSRDKPYRREKAKREEDQVFHARPVKHKRSSEKTRQVDYDQDDGGVFKAKSQNRATKGAKQVDDSRNLKTDLPVDQRPAEEVREDDHGRYSPRDDYENEEHYQEDTKGKDKKKKKQEPQQTYRANAKRADSPNNEQAHREAEQKARQRREEEDRERAEKTRRQQEAMRQKRKDKEEKKKEEPEERKKKEDVKRRREEVEQERRQREEEERRWLEEEEEEEKRKKRTSTPKKQKDQHSEHERSPRETPQRSATEMLREQQEKAATDIQRTYRGYRTRKELKQRQAEEEYRRARDQASDLVQDDKDWGPGPDDYRSEDEKRENAAITIQAGFRGYQARREVRAMRGY